MMVRISLHAAAVTLVVMVAGVVAANPTQSAESFRVDNKVFVEAEKEPHSQSATIFHEGLVYDFLEKPAEITVLDARKRRFVLLDPAHRVRTELSTDEVAAVCDNLRRWGQRQTDPLLQFMANPKFEQQFDEASGELVFLSPWMTYRVASAPAEGESTSRPYREFSDWYTRLNTRLNPGSKFPFPRLEVNEALEKRGEVPREVRVSMQPKKGHGQQRPVARSEHLFTIRLSQADRERIGQAEQFMAIFQPVDFQQYQQKMGR